MAALNQSATFSADISNYIQETVLPLTIRQLVVYQFGDKLTLPKNRGTTYTASRYDRVPLPFASLSEGIAPFGQNMTLAQVTAVASQWGDTISVTDVAGMTIHHDLFKQSIDLIATQQAETVERNTFNSLLAGTQINYVNTRGSRAALQAGDVLSGHELNRAVAALRTIGAREFLGPTDKHDTKVQAGKVGTGSKDPSTYQHYVAVQHTNTEQDLREDTNVVAAWSRSDVNRLYNNEIGTWGGVRFVRSNLVPTFTGVAQVNGTPGAAGVLNNNTYYIKVTGSNGITQYEERIYQVSTGITTVAGANAGSISVTIPTLVGYTFNVYVGTTTSPTNLATCASGPTTGPLAGQAVQLASGASVVLTGIGTAQTPPAAPTTGITVYPTFIFGKNAYGIVMLDDVKHFFINKADHADPLNQIHVVGWKMMYGMLIQNQNFFMRIESTSAFSANFG